MGSKDEEIDIDESQKVRMQLRSASENSKISKFQLQISEFVFVRKERRRDSVFSQQFSLWKWSWICRWIRNLHGYVKTAAGDARRIRKFLLHDNWLLVHMSVSLLSNVLLLSGKYLNP